VAQFYPHAKNTFFAMVFVNLGANFGDNGPVGPFGDG
jgi:hypothetical protein